MEYEAAPTTFVAARFFAALTSIAGDARLAGDSTTSFAVKLSAHYPNSTSRVFLPIITPAASTVALAAAGLFDDFVEFENG